MKELCCVCGAKKSRATCHIIVLTDEEKKALEGQGPLPAEFIYCRPCWRTLSNPKTAPKVMQGLMRGRLRQLGVEGADAIAQRFHDRLAHRISNT